MRRISPFNWSTDLRDLPQMNFLQLYDYLVVSARKDRYTHRYKKAEIPSVLFRRDNTNKLESEVFENKTFVRASVLPSMKKKTPYRVVVEFALTCEVLRAARTCPAGPGRKGKVQQHRGSTLSISNVKRLIFSHRKNKPSFRTHKLIPITIITCLNT